MIEISVNFDAEMMLLYLCFLATIGVLMKAWQLFGTPKKQKIYK